MFLFSAFATDVASELGTANTCVFARGRGIVLNEPSIVAFNTAKGCVEAVGTEAHEMLGRTPANIKPVRPMKDGVIADFDAAEKMLMHFVKKATGSRPLLRPRLVIGVPPEITQVERRAVKDSGFRVKASEVYLVDEPMAAAIGSGLPITEAAGNMVVDIGGGTTDIAVIACRDGVWEVASRGRACARRLDHSVNRGLTPPDRRADGGAGQVRSRVGDAARRRAMEVKGATCSTACRARSSSATPKSAAISEPLKLMIQAVRDAFERVPPTVGRHHDRGVVLTGGGALLKNLDKRLRDETGLPVLVAENPLTSVVLGAGKILSDTELLKKVAAD